ncbi:MAG TPA: arsenic transporter [Candidatus Acidoferrales bacterium]|nr:arsenic transporter [Candidatus Acidoferrales bacterium]
MNDAGTLAVAALVAAGIVVRPFRLPEAVWAVAAAFLLVAFGWLPIRDALHAVALGSDVYLFLTGMMLLSEVARRGGVFEWIATHAVNAARGSTLRLFALIYGAGVVVTAIMSNDATAVVLTPAVFAAAGKAGVKPLPLLFVCAFVANAASFVFPISNPANLVVYGAAMPALPIWLERFALPSLAAIAATYAVLLWTQRAALRGACRPQVGGDALDANGRFALTAIAVTAAVLLIVSGLGLSLGLPAAVLGAIAVVATSVRGRVSVWPVLENVPWSILPLVAGLFVLVEAVRRTGAFGWLAALVAHAAASSQPLAAAASGAAIALGSNAINNLPAGLIARTIVQMTHAVPRVTDAMLIGVDLGPNLSIAGSLATILWLAAIRREGQNAGFGSFIRIGIVAMPSALLLALAARLLLP